jgi:signal transduction histidine kinase
VFTVRDSGIGISPELQHRVFDRLFRADAARSRKDLPGSGLGLSIVKWIAEIHGFRVDLKSKLKDGSTFSVVIPAHACVLVEAEVKESSGFRQLRCPKA